MNPALLGKRGIILVVVLLLATGCAGLPDELQGFSSWVTNTINKARTPGAKLIETPQKVSGDFDCPSRPQPWVLLQNQDVWPPKLAATDELGQHFVYVLCPARGGAEVRGALTRVVRTGGKIVWSDVERDYELKPGRWSVDFFLTIPSTAAAGSYEFEVSFETSRVLFRDVKWFTVVRR